MSAINSDADLARLFQLSGLLLKFDAAEFLFDRLSVITRKPSGTIIDADLVDFIEHVKHSPAAISLPLVDIKLVESVFNENYKEGSAGDAKRHASVAVEDFSVVSAFDCPRFAFDHERSRFSRLSNRPDPFPDCTAKAKIELYVRRYWVLLERLRRSQVFAQASKNTPSIVQTSLAADPNESNGMEVDGVVKKRAKKFVLTSVECLLGSAVEAASGSEKVTVVFGLLTRMKDGNWYLEDPTGFVKLDLSSSAFQSGLIGEHCFVLAEGRFDDGDSIFRARGVGLPPSESAANSRATGPCGDLNLFGGSQTTCVAMNQALAERARLKMAESGDSLMAVILSDVWLDVRAVMDKLQLLFAGYAEQPPFVLIFCGNFLSTHYGEKHSSVFRGKFHFL